MWQILEILGSQIKVGWIINIVGVFDKSMMLYTKSWKPKQICHDYKNLVYW